MPYHTTTDPESRAWDIVLHHGIYLQDDKWGKDNQAYHQDMIMIGQIAMELSNQVADD